MNIFSYKMDHDYGLAPNPFWGYMTLAVCKGPIRSNPNLKIGDWIIATGSVSLGFKDNLIYAMRVEQIIPFDEYWNNPDYALKRPVLNGSLAQMYGDNFYHHDESGNVIQEASAHSNSDGTVNETHCRRDIDGKNVIISRSFYYFGNQAPKIPKVLRGVICKARGYCYAKISDELKNKFMEWLNNNYNPGIYGEPISWENFDLPKIEMYDDELEC
ncbi:MAG: hypothetical protein NC453_25395 [Muribaculum sp.]|nr:hypothetical protein [Muribaculum sp.]